MMFKKKKRKSNEPVELQEYQDFDIPLVQRIIPAFVVFSLILLGAMFIDEYSVYLDEKKEEEAKSFENRFVFKIRTPSGACPTGSTPYNLTACLTLREAPVQNV